MKKNISVIVVLWCVGVIMSALASGVCAEQILTKDKRIIEGNVVAENDMELYIETPNGMERIPKSRIALRGSQDLADYNSEKYSKKKDADVVAEQKPPANAQERFQRLYYNAREWIARDLPAMIKHGINQIRPYNERIINWVEGTPVYKVLMKIQQLRDYKRKNPAGFTMSVYCILLILCAVVIRVVKEGIFLVLSLFGIGPDFKREKR